MPPLFLVMLGGAIGAGFRYHIGTVALRNLGPGFPFGTWIVNLLGGLLMGVLAGVVARAPIEGEPLRLFLGVGVLGGFTTFSAFSLESFNMLSRGDYMMAGAYAVSSVAGSIMFLFLGVLLARGLA
ncbi:camphor resistance protein CrcB [Sphingomonas sp. Root710]|uniref:fluoride efflux transporter CrcB n=1 Tax=Sphingomonas sp. Root710 TaxID=1736594 RepID=UPI0006F83C62|nr:fluoride efflux transporter CrcB [Sphingomonas sp. Root710]KRB79384.1 camphor resistance protein CrcB [Sphingomonas sp. Root710]